MQRTLAKQLSHHGEIFDHYPLLHDFNVLCAPKMANLAASFMKQAFRALDAEYDPSMCF